MIVAVVVTYHPKLGELSRLLDALGCQVDQTIVIDNGDTVEVSGFVSGRNDPGLHCLPLGGNLGVAAAQNAGIAWARERGAEFVVLFDQDSEPAADMIARLHGTYQRLLGEGFHVAAVGPRYVDERNIDHSSFSRSSGFRLIKEDCTSNGAIIRTDFVIASGSLISMDTLHRVGGMNDALFVDQIDIEWCLRAKSLGYQCFGVCNAVMRHSLGDAPLIFLGRKLINHNPLRHYYIFRNAVWLISRKYVPYGWRLRFARVIVVRYLVYPLYVSPRFDFLKMMTKGLWHGMTGRMGRLDMK